MVETTGMRIYIYSIKLVIIKSSDERGYVLVNIQEIGNMYSCTIQNASIS